MYEEKRCVWVIASKHNCVNGAFMIPANRYEIYLHVYVRVGQDNKECEKKKNVRKNNLDVFFFYSCSSTLYVK